MNAEADPNNDNAESFFYPGFFEIIELLTIT